MKKILLLTFAVGTFGIGAANAQNVTKTPAMQQNPNHLKKASQTSTGIKSDKISDAEARNLKENSFAKNETTKPKMKTTDQTSKKHHKKTK
ncbi:hypothetical protein EGI22_04040 [Lacihabitans sp. LS3-19]|uniref:hypothetical protein n=1 Tax=Lacihabitans sp. LS3-19 TaxID=2487335 RepID=UPI0020CC58E2|nr:hypothetical protein [Lacihabitans sp. LS3-19]MCP9767068.1 hypothetical protein [Lacihabitans sp. LS3-19]